MVHKAEGGGRLVPFQSLDFIEQLKTSADKQIFYLFRSAAATGGLISIGQDIDGLTYSPKDNSVAEKIQAYVNCLDPSVYQKFFIASSTAPRAIDTAKLFIQALQEKSPHAAIALEQTEELLERSVGKQAGQPRTGPEYKLKVQRWKNLSAEEKFKKPEMENMGYETFEEVAMRTMSCLKRIALDHPKATCFLFTHVHNIEAIAIPLLNLTLSSDPGSNMPLEHLEPLEALMIEHSEGIFLPTLRLIP